MALGLVACGGDDGDDGDGAGGGGDPVASANSICSDATAEAEAFAESNPAPSGPEEVDAALAEDSRIAEQVAADLGELETPGGGFDTFVDAQEEVASIYAEQVAAVEAKDPDAFAETSERLLQTTGIAKTAADGAGLDDCPNLPVSVFYAGGESGPDAGAGPESSSSAILGTWAGQVTQYGPGDETSDYPVEMTITSTDQGAAAGTVEYPTLSCGGELRLSRGSGQGYVFRERITSGRKQCTDGGAISATVSGDSMDWRWVGPGVEVLGTLSRED